MSQAPGISGDSDPERESRRQYESPDFERWLHRKERRVTDEVRKLSASIHSHKVLGSEWKEQCHALRRLTEIAFDELTVSGKGRPSDGEEADDEDQEETLWDAMESENVYDDVIGKKQRQSVVRLLLEEGKLNLVLRLLTNFKALDETEDFKVSLEIECNRKKMRMSTLIQLCSIYEQSLGILLFFCIRRIESMQILDAQHLVEWIGRTLSRKRVHFKVKSERMDSFFVRSFGEDKRSEIVALYFLFILSTHFTKIQLEERLMGHIERYHLIHKSIVFVMEHHHILSLDVLQKYTLFLSHCFAAESFSAEPDLFFVADDTDDPQKQNTQRMQTMSLLTEFYTKYTEHFVAKKAIKRKQIRAYSKQYHRFKKLLK